MVDSTLNVTAEAQARARKVQIADEVLGKADHDLMSDSDYSAMRRGGVGESEAKQRLAQKKQAQVDRANGLPEQNRIPIGQDFGDEDLGLGNTGRDTAPNRLISDSANSLALKGSIAAGEGVVGLTNIATMGKSGEGWAKLGYDPRKAKEFLSGFESEETKASRAARAKAEGFWPSVEANLENPRALVQDTLESVPGMLLGGAYGRTLGASKAFPKLAAAAPYIGEGLVQAGQSAEQTRQETGGLTPVQAALALSSGVIDAVISKISGKVGDRFGAADIDVLTAGGKAPVKVVAKNAWEQAKNTLKQVGGGILGESGEELVQTAQEKIHQNIAEGKPPMQGVAEDAAAGMLSGTVMGGAVNVGNLALQNGVPEVPPVPEPNGTVETALAGQPAQPETMRDVLGRIPNGILPIQKDPLTGLEVKAPEEDMAQAQRVMQAVDATSQHVDPDAAAIAAQTESRRAAEAQQAFQAAQAAMFDRPPDQISEPLPDLPTQRSVVEQSLDRGLLTPSQRQAAADAEAEAAARLNDRDTPEAEAARQAIMAPEKPAKPGGPIIVGEEPKADRTEFQSLKSRVADDQAMAPVLQQAIKQSAEREQVGALGGPMFKAQALLAEPDGPKKVVDALMASGMTRSQAIKQKDALVSGVAEERAPYGQPAAHPPVKLSGRDFTVTPIEVEGKKAFVLKGKSGGEYAAVEHTPGGELSIFSIGKHGNVNPLAPGRNPFPGASLRVQDGNLTVARQPGKSAPAPVVKGTPQAFVENDMKRSAAAVQMAKDLVSQGLAPSEVASAIKKANPTMPDRVIGRIVENRVREAKTDGTVRETAEKYGEKTDLAETWKDRGEAATDRNYSIGAERGERATKASSALTTEEKTALEKAAKETGDDPAEAKAAAREVKARFPRADGWAPLEVVGIKPVKKADDDVEEDDAGKDSGVKARLIFRGIPYSFHNPPGWTGGSGLNPNSPKAEPWISSMADRVTAEIVALTKRAENGDATAQAIMDHVTWYRQMARRLRDEFGGFGDAFADLLGATSPNTPVKTNWRFSVDLLRRFVRGDFDSELAAYEKAIAEGIGPKEFATRFKAQLLRQVTGKQYGINSVNAAKALVGMWRAIKANDAPKAKNFALNLIGQSDKATIDVWAARMLQRLAKRERVPRPAEGAVSGNHMVDPSQVGGQFGFGQKVLEQAAKQLRDKGVNISAPDLQAVAWFLEKELWTKNGWTSTQGEGGSFEEQLDSLPVDRYQAMATIQSTKPPTDKQMAAARDRMTDTLKGDADVIAYRANPSLGMYAGGEERSFDQEVVAKAGWSPARWIASLSRVAKKAKQMDIGITRVIRPNEQNANARPGMEVYFRSPQDLEKVRPLLDKIVASEVDGFTLAVDTLQRRATTGGQQASEFIGIRMQYVPEMAMRGMDKDSEQYKALASGDQARVQAVLEEMGAKIDVAIAGLMESPEVAYAAAYDYDTLVIGQENYDAYTDPKSGAADRAFGPESSRQPIADRLAEAARRLEGRPGDVAGAVLQPPSDGRAEARGVEGLAAEPRVAEEKAPTESVAREGRAAYAYLPDGTELQRPETRADAVTAAREAIEQLSLDFGPSSVSDPARDLAGVRPAPRTQAGGPVVLDAHITVPESLKERGRVDLVGQVVRTDRDLAVVARVARDPRVETMGFAFTDQNGVILAQELLSSREPGYVAAFDTPAMEPGTSPAKHREVVRNARNKFMQRLRHKMDRLSQRPGVTEVKLVMWHNHPGGHPGPSTEDVALTQQIARNVPGFAFHVVLNGDKFGVIELTPAAGDARYIKLDKEWAGVGGTTFSEDSGHRVQFVGTKPLVGKDVSPDQFFVGANPQLVNTPSKLAEFADGWRKQRPEGQVIVAILDAQNKTRAVIPVPAGLFKNVKAFSDFMRGMNRAWGGRGAVAVFNSNGDPAMKNAALKHVRRGVMLDYLDEHEGNRRTLHDVASDQYGAETEPKAVKSFRVGEEQTSRREPQKGGFYSALERAASQMRQPMKGSDALRFLSSREGVKKAEIEATKLEKFLEGKAKVTPAEVQEFLKSAAVKVETKTLGETKDLNRLKKEHKQAEERAAKTRSDYDETKGALLRALPRRDADLALGVATGYPDDAKFNRRLFDFEASARDAIVGFRDAYLANSEAMKEYGRTAEALDAATKSRPKTFYGQYVTPGGRNYRENLHRIPSKQDRIDSMTRKQLGNWYKDEVGYDPTEDDPYTTDAELRNMVRTYPNPTPYGASLLGGTDNYRGPHFNGEMNVIAHDRTSERKLSDGSKMLLADEIQADAAQEGRRSGFKMEKPTELKIDPNIPPARRSPIEGVNGQRLALQDHVEVVDQDGRFFTNVTRPDVEGEFNEENVLAEAWRRANEEPARTMMGRGVPRLPFIEKTEEWATLALKKLLVNAAERGMDHLGWTTGAMQFDRWGSERFDWKRGAAFNGGRAAFEAAKDGWLVSASRQSGGNAGGVDLEGEARRRGLLKDQGRLVKTKEELTQLVRQNLEHPEDAQKVVDRMWTRMQTEDEGTSMPRKEGMEGFYDKILPDLANKILKKWGAKVGTTEIPTLAKNQPRGGRIVDENGVGPEATPNGQATTAVHSIQLTDSMKRDIKNEGFALFEEKQPYGDPHISTSVAEERAPYGLPPQPKPEPKAPPIPAGMGRPVNITPMAVDDIAARVAAASKGTGTPDGTPISELAPPEFHRNMARVLQVLEKPQAERLARIYDVFDKEMDTARGRLSWEQGDKEALKLLGVHTREQFLQMAQRGVIFNEPGLRAATRVMYEVEAENREALQTLEEAKAKGGGGVDSKEFQDYVASSTDLAAWIMALRGEQAEAARAFGARKDLKGARNPLEKLIGALGRSKKATVGGSGLTNEQIAQVIQIAQQDPGKLPDLIRQIQKPTFWDMINEWRKGAMLFGVRTYGVNFFGNAFKQAVTLAEIPPAAVADYLKTPKGQERQVYLGELAAARAGIADFGGAAWAQLVQDSKKALQGVEEFDPETNKYEVRVGAIPGPLGKFIRTPFRMLTAADNFFKNLARGQSLYREAYRRARNEGLTGENAAKRADELINIGRGSDWQDRRVAGMLEKANRVAEYETFTQRANYENAGMFGAIAEGISRLEKSVPPIGLFAPFKATPANIAFQGYERSPLAWVSVKNRANELADLEQGMKQATRPAEKKRIQDAINQKRLDFANQVSRAAIGSAIFTVAAAMAAMGLLTGTGPSDWDKNRVWRKAGNVPNAIKVGDSDWYAYDRFEPMATVVSMAASVPEMFKETSAVDVGGRIIDAMHDAFVAKTYLQGMEQLGAIIKNPKAFSAKWLRDLEGSFIPAFVAHTAEAMDPVVRDNKGGLLDPAKARIPGLSKTLRQVNTGTGEPAAKTQRLGGQAAGPVNPLGFIRTGPSKGDPLYQQFLEADYAPDEHKTFISIGVGPVGAKKQERVDLTEDEMERFRRADEVATRILRGRINDPAFQRLDPDQKKANFRREYDRASDAVKKTIMPAAWSRLQKQLAERRKAN